MRHLQLIPAFIDTLNTGTGTGIVSTGQPAELKVGQHLANTQMSC
jgi:hypothetical protein